MKKREIPKNEIFASLSDQLYFNQLAEKFKLFLASQSIENEGETKEKHFRNKESVLQVFKFFTTKKRNEFNKSIGWA
jgi:hypothetical protein